MIRKTLPPLVAMLLSLSFAHGLCTGDEGIDILRRNMASPDYETRKSVVTNVFYQGEKRPLKKDEIDLLLSDLKSDTDWRIKVKIICALRYAENTDWVLQPLIAALQDREETSSGQGNVPVYASKALVRLGDARAIEPLREWLQYLERHPDAYPDLREIIIENANADVAALEKALEEKGRWGEPPVGIVWYPSELHRFRQCARQSRAHKMQLFRCQWCHGKHSRR